jgi:hypothetical protein
MILYGWFPLLSGVLAQLLPSIGTEVVMMDSLVGYDLFALVAGQMLRFYWTSGRGGLQIHCSMLDLSHLEPGPIDPCRRQRAIVPFEDTINSFAIMFSLLLCSIRVAFRIFSHELQSKNIEYTQLSACRGRIGSHLQNGARSRYTPGKSSTALPHAVV